MIKRFLRSHTAESSRARSILFKSLFETIIQTNEDYYFQQLLEIAEVSLKSIDEFKDFPFLFVFGEIASKDMKRQYLALRFLGNLFTMKEELGVEVIYIRMKEFQEWLVQKVIDADLISILIDLLGKDHLPHLQIESVRILQFIVSMGTIKQCKTLADFAIILPILQLLNSKNIDIVESVKYYFSFFRNFQKIGYLVYKCHVQLFF